MKNGIAELEARRAALRAEVTGTIPMFDRPPTLDYRASENLVEKYRPQRIADLVGQDHVAHALRQFVAAPYPVAFLFSGETGTGKTSAAIALAKELGCAVEYQELGGLWQIASGEQTVGNVRDLLARLHSVPFYGSGWRVVIVNEADYMPAQAEAVWLDALENLPGRCVVIFTTNAAAKLSSRFQDRCDSLVFASGKSEAMRSAVTVLVRRICEAETGSPDTIPPATVPGIMRDDCVSFRRVVQGVSRLLRERSAAVA